MKILASILWIVFELNALMAAGYTLKTVKILPMESYPARATVGTITIAADPYYTDEKSYSAFDVKNLNSRGYFPVHVIIQNKSPDFLIVRTRNIVLITNSGERLYTTPVSILLDDVFKAGSVDKLSENATGKSSKKSRVGSPHTDFANKDLTNRLIDPGKVTDGFLFFTNPDPKLNIFAGGTLYIPNLEEEGTHRSIGPFSILLDPAISLKE
jgi:hypothetical protein